MDVIKVKIEGPVGSGKTTVGALVASVLQDFGFGVVSNEQEEVDQLSNATLEMRRKYLLDCSRVEIEVGNKAVAEGLGGKGGVDHG